jgi:hypothetical protein
MDFAKLQQKLLTHKPSVPLLSNSEPFPDDRANNMPSFSLPPSHSVEMFDDRRANDEQTNLLRLQYDFEFVQHLVSPDYIKYLTQKDYFKQ